MAWSLSGAAKIALRSETSSLRGFAVSSAVITKNIYPFPKRSPEGALEPPTPGWSLL
jgi:hypothetical protein